MSSDKIIGTGLSKYTMPLYHTREPVQPTEASLRKMMENGYRTTSTNQFQTVNKALADAVIPTCLSMVSDNDKFRECHSKLLSSSPVWLTEEKRDKDRIVIETIRTKVTECADIARGNKDTSKTYACLENLSKYAMDLNNYGVPRMYNPNFLKMVEFVQGLCEEASKYTASNEEEEAIRQSLLQSNQFGLSPMLHLMGPFEQLPGMLPCGCVGYATHGEVGLPYFTDFYTDTSPSKMYVFIHELGHAISHSAVTQIQTKGYYQWRGYNKNCTTCPNSSKTVVCGQQWSKSCMPAYSSHDEFWHKCCIFLSHMIKRHFRTKGIATTDEQYAKRVYLPSDFSGYHLCHQGSGRPTLSNPGTWEMDKETARTGGNDMSKVPPRACPA